MQRMIARLGAPLSPSASRRRFVGATSDTPVAGIIDEVGATIMARRLEFRNADGATLALEIRNRRLFRAEFDRPDGVFDTENLEGVTGADFFGRLLRAFCAVGGITVESQGPLREAEPDESGLSTGRLRRLLDEPVTPPASAVTAAPPSFGGFIEMAVPLARAWLLRDGADAYRSGGAGELGAGLRRALDSYESTLTDLAAGRPLGLLLESGGVTAEQLGVFADGAAVFALVVPLANQAAFLSICSSWQRGLP